MSLLDRLKKLLGVSGNGGGGGTAVGTAAMISCEDALQLVHEYLDGELDDVPAAEVKQHFDMCQRCYPHLHLETVFRDALRRANAGQAAPEELKSRITGLIAEARAGEG
ncbi:MAG: mycothiol system anti-sigma-R factor [Gemmatimonadota bacterium]